MKMTKDNLNRSTKTFLPAICALALVLSSGIAAAGFIDYDHSAESAGSSTQASTEMSNGQPTSWSGFVDYDHSSESPRNPVVTESDAIMSQPRSMQGFIDYDHSAQSSRS